MRTDLNRYLMVLLKLEKKLTLNKTIGTSPEILTKLIGYSEKEIITQEMIEEIKKQIEILENKYVESHKENIKEF